jgi:hypothetical protein
MQILIGWVLRWVPNAYYITFKNIFLIVILVEYSILENDVMTNFGERRISGKAFFYAFIGAGLGKRKGTQVQDLRPLHFMVKLLL